MSWWVQTLLVIALASVVLMVISENRHPVRTLAWIAVLCFLPVLGVILYIVFGIEMKHRRLISDSKLAELKDMVTGANSENTTRNLPDGHSDLGSLLWMTNKSIPLTGNSVRVYIRFDDMFNDLLSDIASAKDHIHLEFFKFEDDEVGRRIGSALIEKAREGVEVRLCYDAAANLTRHKFYKWLRSGGVQTKAFHPVFLPFLTSSTNYRNHRKLVVIDGRVGYTGGMNIAERYSKGVRGGDWRDTHVRVEGPAAAEMQVAFLVDWQFVSKKFICSQRYFPKCDAAGGSVVQIATSGPMDEWNVTMQGMMRIISQARRYVYIESPYLVPTEPLLMALRNAALSGVDVRLIIPYTGDNGILVPLATRSYVSDAIVAGVKVYFYGGGYLHSKTIVADDTIATIGSTNIDVRSFEQNFEINAFFYDRKVAAELREAFLADQSRSTLVDPVEWAARPRLEKIKESFARLFSPIL
jgi:Phosphatidylserine/phosphatidylglycerophosphate/cardiolipin synthases and related enzymes